MRTKNKVDSECSNVKVYPDIDGGWGWMVVLGCTLMHLFLGGWSRSYGIVYVRLRERFKGTAAVTAWIGGVGIAVRMGLSPLATALAKKYSARKVTFIGGLLFSGGIFIIGFGPSIAYMFFSISFMAGFGGCLIYSPAIVHVGEYFDKRRGVATGIATAGSGLGVFLLPPFLKLLFNYYGFVGAIMIFGGLMSHCCISAALYRPLEAKNRVIKPEKRQSIQLGPATISNEKSKIPSKVPTVTGLRKYLDYKLLLDLQFLSFAISLGLVTTSYMSAQMLVTDHAIECGVDETRATVLLSLIGAADIFGRLGSGILFDRKHIRPIRRHFYQWAIALSASTIYGWAFSSTFSALAICSILHGFFNGCVVSQRAVIVADIMGIEKLSSSFGLTVCCQGFGALIGPYVAGHLRDMTGNYKASFYYTGTSSAVAFVILYISHFHYLRNRKPEKKLKFDMTMTIVRRHFVKEHLHRHLQL